MNKIEKLQPILLAIDIITYSWGKFLQNDRFFFFGY